jgi:large subunit ribosomal protein L6
MSRIGLAPISLPSGVEVKIEGNTSTVKGPRGVLEQHIPSGIEVTIADGEVRCSRSTDSPKDRSNHGLVRALIANQVHGVTEGFTKSLTVVGVGYRAELKGKDLSLNLGHSHPILYKAPEGVEFEVPDQNHIVVKGSSKQRVGQAAAEIRDFRPPEPYKGKGVRYDDEKVQKKAGKAAAKG